MSAELTWIDPAVDLNLYLAAPGCHQLYPMANCALIAKSDSPGGTNEQVSKNVVAGETVTLFVDNRSRTAYQAVALRFAIE